MFFNIYLTYCNKLLTLSIVICRYVFVLHSSLVETKRQRKTFVAFIITLIFFVPFVVTWIIFIKRFLVNRDFIWSKLRRLCLESFRSNVGCGRLKYDILVTSFIIENCSIASPTARCNFLMTCLLFFIEAKILFRLVLLDNYVR